MADAVQIFNPGDRLTDASTGAPLSGATVYFYDAGTSTPKTVYSDSDLLVQIGTSLKTNALGYPTSDGGTTQSLVYTGTALYKIIIKDAAAVTIATHDNVKGAAVSATGGAVTVSFSRPVVTKSLDYTIVVADLLKIFAGNCSAADVTFTLPSAVLAGQGALYTIQHAGSANQCIGATVLSQTISEGSKSFGTAMTLALNGEEATFVSDGGNWRVINHCNPLVHQGQGIITVVSRLATSPASPGQGDIYIVTAAAGAWSTFAIGDLALYTGAGWVNITPPSNCGWVSWVQAENLRYLYITAAWVAESATTAFAGTVRLADATAMEAATAGRGVTADFQHRHPGHPKAWGLFNTSTLATSYGVTSLTRNALGNYTITLSTAMSSASYAVIVTACTATSSSAATAATVAVVTDLATGSFRILTTDNNTDNFVEGLVVSFAVFGDQ